MGGGRWSGVLALVFVGALAATPGTAAAADGDVEERTIPVSAGGPAQAVAFDEEGRLWLAVIDLGLVRYDPDSGETDEFPIDGITSNVNLQPDAAGGMWVTLEDPGAAARIPIDADDAAAIQRIDFDVRSRPSGLTLDDRGRVWVADVVMDRLYRIDPADLDADPTVVELSGFANPTAVQLVGDELWFCGTGTISRIDPDTTEAIEPEISIGSYLCVALLPIGDDVYVASEHNQGLLRVRDGGYEVVAETPGRTMGEVAVDERNRIWLAPGTYPLNEVDGHVAWDIEQGELLPVFGSFAGDVVGVAVAPDGDVWFAAGAGGSPDGTVAVQRVQVGTGTTEQILSAFERVPGFSDALTPENLGRTAGLTVLVVLLVMFPSALVNATLEAKGDQLPWVRRREARQRTRPPLVRLAILLAALPVVYIAQALVFELRDGGSDLGVADTALQALASYGVGVLVATLVMMGMDWWSLRRAGVGVAVEVRSSTLPIAIGCALISALMGFQPGFVFGLIFGLQPRRPMEPSADANRVAWSAWVAAGVGVAAWISADAFADATYPWLACMGIYVASVEVVFLEMAPLRFLPGHLVWTVHFRRWITVWGPGAFLFILGLVAPGVNEADALNVWAAAVLVAAFNLGAAGFWFWGWRHAD